MMIEVNKDDSNLNTIKIYKVINRVGIIIEEMCDRMTEETLLDWIVSKHLEITKTEAELKIAFKIEEIE